MEKDGLLDLFTMSNLSPKTTGLPFVVWISPRGNAQHDLRVKVSRGPKAVPAEFVTVALRPEVRVVRGRLSSADLALLKQWLKRNETTLVKFWQGDIEYTEEVLRKLRAI